MAEPPRTTDGECEVVDGAEGLAEMSMGQVAEARPLPFPGLIRRRSRNSSAYQPRSEARPMGARSYDAATVSSPAWFGSDRQVARACRPSSPQTASGPPFRSRTVQRQLGEKREEPSDHRGRLPERAAAPPPVVDNAPCSSTRRAATITTTLRSDRRHEEDCEPDGFVEAPDEESAESGDEEQRKPYPVLKHRGCPGVLRDVGGGIGGGERDGDDEVGGEETQEAEHDELTPPVRQEVLEHGDGALAVRALLRDTAVDGRAEEAPDGGQGDGGRARRREEGDAGRETR